MSISYESSLDNKREPYHLCLSDGHKSTIYQFNQYYKDICKHLTLWGKEVTLHIFLSKHELLENTNKLMVAQKVQKYVA